MDIRQIITDYIRRTILTTQGDLLVRGATQPEALAGVALGQVLKSGGVGAKPAWGAFTLTDMGIAFNNYVKAASGDQVITGVGFQPSMVLVFAVDSTPGNINSSIGIDINGTRFVQYICEAGTVHDISTAYSMLIRRGGANMINGLLTAVGADGFTVTHVLTGACSADIYCVAIG